MTRNMILEVAKSRDKYQKLHMTRLSRDALLKMIVKTNMFTQSRNIHQKL